jgi:hypothetical protein
MALIIMYHLVLEKQIKIVPTTRKKMAKYISQNVKNIIIQQAEK